MKSIQKNIISELKSIIEHGKSQIASSVNYNLTLTYWNIGNRIKNELLENKRAEYGKQLVSQISARLVEEYGSSFAEKNLRRMIQFSEIFPKIEIVASLMRQLSWTHFTLIFPLKSEIERDFYLQMCRLENWSVRTLRKKIDSMLYERTSISKKPEELARLELNNLKEEDKITPDLIFRDHYVLDFLNLKDTFQERDFEQSILRELENFILELGISFTFVARQKRMIIDNEDYFLDLLFFNRKLKRLVAIELKIGKFKASYKGQMELYLRWLEKFETEENEEKPIGLILCAEGNNEQIELMQLDKENIKVAEYITQKLPKKLLAEKLHQFSQNAKNIILDKDETEKENK